MVIFSNLDQLRGLGRLYEFRRRVLRLTRPSAFRLGSDFKWVSRLEMSRFDWPYGTVPQRISWGGNFLLRRRESTSRLRSGTMNRERQDCECECDCRTW